MGMGLERPLDDRHRILVRLPAFGISLRIRSVSLRSRRGRRVASLSNRLGRPELFRYSLHLLLRLLRTRRSGGDSCYRACDRLLERSARTISGRRTKLQIQPDEPDAAAGGI